MEYSLYIVILVSRILDIFCFMDNIITKNVSQKFEIKIDVLFCAGVVNRNRTLFTYRIGESYDNFRDVDFTPVFVDDTSSLFSNSTLEQEARNICGEIQECLFDIAVTGKTSIGEATVELINELEEKINNSKIGKGISLSHAMRPGLQSAIFGWQDY